MKKEVKEEEVKLEVYIAAVVFAIIIISTLNIVLREVEQVNLSPFEPELPQDCSDAQIKSGWDQIFYETSNGINIYANGSVVNGKCESYAAYKISGNTLYVLSGYEDYGEYSNSSTVNALIKEYKQENITDIENFMTEHFEQDYFGFYLFALIFPNPQIDAKRTNEIKTYAQAQTEAESIFRGAPLVLQDTEWINDTEEDYYGKNETLRIFYQEYEETIQEDSQEREISHGFLVWGNYTNAFYTYRNNSIYPCESEWEVEYEYCSTEEKIIEVEYDQNYCEFSEYSRNRETDQDCDRDLDGFIGNISDINNNMKLRFILGSQEINDTLESFTLANETIVIKDDNETVVRTNFDFSSTSLNLRELEIRKQPTSAKIGYVIVNGLEVPKTIYVDKLNETSNQVCIKEASVSNINQISDECDDNDEVLLNCPQTSSGITCAINAGRFKVEGVDHSAIKEYVFVNDTEDSCVSNWDCEAWSVCSEITSSQSRLCTDTNNCRANYTQTQECQVLKINQTACTEDWTCTEWEPSECPKNGTQVRTCADENTCGTQEEKPLERRTCQAPQNTDGFFFVVFIIVLLIVAVLIGIIVVLIGKKSKFEYVEEEDPYTP